MHFLRAVVWMLVLLCGWRAPAQAQQVVRAVPVAAGRPLRSAADTVAALHGLFAKKRASSGLFLAATPVALVFTLGAVGATAVGQLSGNAPSAVPPVLALVGGGLGTAMLLNRYLRYTKGQEQRIVDRYAQAHALPRWVQRNLARHQAARP